MGRGPDASFGPHAFVAELASPELTDSDRHHFERVLRLRRGDLLSVSDGRGGWRACLFGSELEPVGDIETVARPVPAIGVGFALVKGERPDWIVQKLTELGVDRIAPFVAERSVVRWDEERARRHGARWSVVVREAAMQSRRCWLPDLDPVVLFATVATEPGAALADREGRAPSLDCPFLLVGPEGGWSASEYDSGLTRVRLGPHVLRSETAAVAAGTLLAALREGLMRSSGANTHAE